MQTQQNKPHTPTQEHTQIIKTHYTKHTHKQYCATIVIQIFTRTRYYFVHVTCVRLDSLQVPSSLNVWQNNNFVVLVQDTIRSWVCYHAR